MGIKRKAQRTHNPNESERVFSHSLHFSQRERKRVREKKNQDEHYFKVVTYRFENLKMNLLLVRNKKITKRDDF